MQPLSIVDSKSFCQVLEIAKPRYSMPSRKYMSGKLLSERHTAVHKSITSLLQRCERVCLTLDIWTNRQIRSYLGVTGHCIIDFKLYRVILACCRFYGAHTGEAIVEAFENIVHSCSISGKVDTVITDNASNMKRAFRLLNTKGDSSESSETDDDDEFLDELVPVDLDLDCDIIPTRFSCLSHTIQLVVKDGLNQGNEVKRVLSKVSKLVTHVHHSTQASALFENEIRLQMANATRWNSQLVMLKSFLRVAEATVDQLDYNGKLNAHERSIIKELIEILTPFQWATDLAQSEKKVTASVIVPIVCALRSEMTILSKSKLVATLSSSVEHRLSTYENEEVFQLAAALDPRWKLAWRTPEKASTLKQVSKNLILRNH